MAKRIVIVCDYCGAEYDGERMGDLSLFVTQGSRNLSVGKTDESAVPSDACEACAQKALSALNLRLDRAPDGKYFLTRVK